MAEVPQLARALGRIPSGLFVLTVGPPGSATGLLTSFVQQVGFEPPAVTVAIKKGRDIAARLRLAGAFCLSILHSDSKHLVTHFARGGDADRSGFEGLRTGTGALGIPYLTDALAYIGCELAGESDWSDHVLFCGRVVEGGCHALGDPWVHIRKNGLNY